MHAIMAALLLGQTPVADNLDFRFGSLDGWEGSGFYLTTGAGQKPGLEFGVCSSDAGSPMRKGMIRRVFTVPTGMSKLRFQAFAAVPAGLEADHRLDIVLAGADNQPLTKQMRGENGAWTPATRLMPRWKGKPREYSWDVAHLAGQTLQIVLIDQDDRRGCYLYCNGFRFLPAEVVQDTDFAEFMIELARKNQLSPMARFDSKRFTAISNASEKFTAQRLRYCEIFHDLFFHHFQRKGFALTMPRQRLMLAVFDSPDGFDAYMGRKMPSGITGIYHPASNRLVLYDLNENRALVAHRDKALKAGQKISSLIERTRYVGTVERQTDDFSKEVNLSTTMHEAAHQLSFNTGLLNRKGDVPAWLAEGLACYCESTDQGDWAIGAPNPGRIFEFAGPIRGKGAYIPLDRLIAKDSWVFSNQSLLGYAQSWALFHMLMNERPKQLRSYLSLIQPRQAAEHRLEDFRQAFGVDLTALERRYHEYLRDLAQRYPPQKAR